MRKYTLMFVLMLISMAPQVGRAQGAMMVSDLPNTKENATTATSSIENTLQNIKQKMILADQLKNQAELLANDIKNLAKIRPKSWQDLLQATNQVLLLIQRARLLSVQWHMLTQNYDAIYGTYGPHEYDGPIYWLKRKLWAQNVETANQNLLKTRSETLRVQADLSDSSKHLEEEAQHVQGNLQAAQVQSQMQAVDLRSKQIQRKLDIQREQARHLEEIEQRRKAQAERRLQLELFGRGMSTFKSKAKPVRLIDF